MGIGACLGLMVVFGLWSTVYSALAAGLVNFRIEIIPGPECFDGADNDSDGFIDYPADEECDSASDSSEGTPPVSAGIPPSGGGSSFEIMPATTLTVSGFAYPGSRVLLLQDAQLVATVIADASAHFDLSLSDLSAGDYLFLLFAESVNGRRSAVSPMALTLQKGARTEVSGMVIMPATTLEPVAVQRGEALRLSGDAVPGATLMVELSTADHVVNEQRFRISDNGTFAASISTDGLSDGVYQLKAKEILPDGTQSGYGRTRVFTVGNPSLPREILGACQKGDLNCDGRVNLVDFSIVVYWYQRPLESSFMQTEKSLLSGDGSVDLTDLSIMAYYWTG